jgi:hypothetical protein
MWVDSKNGSIHQVILNCMGMSAIVHCHLGNPQKKDLGRREKTYRRQHTTTPAMAAAITTTAKENTTTIIENEIDAILL